MTEKEQEAIEELKKDLDIEIKECSSSNDYRHLSGLYLNGNVETILNLISKLQSDIEIKDKENKAITYNFEKTVDKLEIAYKVINLMAEQLTTPVHSKEWVIKYFEDEIKANLVEKVGGEDE